MARSRPASPGSEIGAGVGPTGAGSTPARKIAARRSGSTAVGPGRRSVRGDHPDGIGQLPALLGQAVDVILALPTGLDQSAVPQQGQVMAHRGLTLVPQVGAEAADV